MMLGMHRSHTYMLCYYDKRLDASTYGGFFAPLTREPVCTYYSFAAFGELYSLGKEVSSESEDKEVYAVAATDGVRKAIMIANPTECEKKIEMNVSPDFWCAIAYRQG